MLGKIKAVLKGPFVIALLLVGLLALGIAAGIFLQKKRTEIARQREIEARRAEEAALVPVDTRPTLNKAPPPAAESPVAPRYVPLGEQFTANFGRSRRFIIIEVTVGTRYGAEAEALLVLHKLALRSEVMSILADLRFEETKRADAKEEIAAKLQAALNRTMFKLEKFSPIDQTLITNFVVK